ncbi:MULTISPECIES: TetR/AcrR family transcriptional regulator [unclassified Caulobacter]|uniref:TetR/AcrR family transcriptional regulator n=1 Tax=unclassified Caulobacter TaxID=2648921 RepID=UPI000D34D845|nr:MULTISPECIES: TetR/AcrR family transcriptional regulator [unclassified Caulobacter]PTS87424.1 TetR/AcrR family transcriptional regulator [Caulobacter sp. HMWF009]PTT11686.1 TetR/AcrR family transcriptional regulator [Caulobacter sp. HMWF025]
MSLANPDRLPAPRGGPGRPKPRVDRHARGREVVEAAVAVFTEKGLQTATMQDVADKAGMAKILIYRLYPSRQALIDALFGEALAQVEAAALRPWGGYGSGIATLIELGRARPALFRLLLKDARSGPETARWAATCDALLTGLAQPFVAPPPNATEPVRAACAHAARTLLPFIIETWIAGIDRSDGLTDAARIKWFGDIVRAWRSASREAIGLPEAPEPASLAASPPPRAS